LIVVLLLFHIYLAGKHFIQPFFVFLDHLIAESCKRVCLVH